jgi:predicted RNA-binding protein with PIN domain
MPPSAHPELPEDLVSGPAGVAREALSPVGKGDPAGTAPDWRELPDPLRARLAELAADALGKLPTADVPQQLRPVARFAPAKRARLGGAALLGMLQESPRFRTAVLEWLREHRLDALDPNAEDAVAAAAAAVLLGESSAASRVRLVARNGEEAALRAERDAAMARAQRLEAELDRLRAELAQEREAVAAARGEREADLDRLRSKLRQQGVTLRTARDEAEAARAELVRDGGEHENRIVALTAQLERERRRAAAERTRAERAVADAEIARQAAREAREADEVRLALLVDTIDGAVAGLRRELSLGASGRRPADAVRGASTASGQAGRVQDPVALDRLLALPSVHLIVDGYNVTKTGYPDLPLADQRERLIRQLAALRSRTGAEITVVFDGAGVLSIPASSPRGVRVLYSDPGVLADDVIRSLVGAEPGGRPLVVATSDRAVAESVRPRGAHAVPSAVLLMRLGRV